MKLKGVITGDIVQSSKIEPTRRKLLIDCIQKIADEAGKWGKIKVEIFRGDSFQAVIDDVEQSLKIAILFRAGLQGFTPEKEFTKWDARIALGIGSIDFYQDHSVVESDGEAFRNSGREFDRLEKSDRLALKTPWDDLNDEFKISTAFADNVISGWTVMQARVIYEALLSGESQKKIAQLLNKSQQAVSKLANGGRLRLIELYLERFQQQVINQIKN